jgi:hypothetical protein
MGKDNSLSRNILEHLNATTFLGLSIISSPVAGLLPFHTRYEGHGFRYI